MEETKLNVLNDPHHCEDYIIDNEKRYSTSFPYFIEKEGKTNKFEKPISFGCVKSTIGENGCQIMTFDIRIKTPYKIYAKSENTISIAIKKEDISWEEVENLMQMSMEDWHKNGKSI